MYNLCFSALSYRKVVSNNCTDGVREQYTAKPQKCPGKAPRGLRIVTADGKLTAEQGHNVTLMVQLEEVRLTPAHSLFCRASDITTISWLWLHMLVHTLKFSQVCLLFYSTFCFMSTVIMSFPDSFPIFIYFKLFFTPFHQWLSLDLTLPYWHC